MLINALALAATQSSAPDVLRLYIPALLSAVCVIRIVMWQRSRHRPISPERARRLLSGTVLVAAMLGLGFAVWSLSFYPYGDPYQQSHVAFFMGITCLCCVFCLMHMPVAATMVAMARAWVRMRFGVWGTGASRGQVGWL